MSDEGQVRATLARYAQCRDENDVAGYVALFAEDARFGWDTVEYAGRPAIRDFISGVCSSQPADRRTKHLVGNAFITIHGNTADATSDVIVYDRRGSEEWKIIQINQHVDKLIRHDDEWLFLEKRLIRL